MISSTSSSDSAARLATAATPDLTTRGRHHHPSVEATGDQISTDSAKTLASALASQPEIRPSEVARARLLAKDDTYPPMPVLQKVASTILRAPDLSEDHS